MTHQPKLVELASRVEAATGPDRELDALIHCATKGWLFSHIGGEYFGTTQDGDRFTVGLPERSASDTAAPTYHKMRSDSLAPRFTASLDAAMTLVPEGLGWAVGSNNTAIVGGSLSPLDMDGPQAATPALALCAASLRARAAMESDDA